MCQRTSSFIMEAIYLYNSTKVECAGVCLKTTNCYAFVFRHQKCRLISQPSHTFDMDTDNGMMTMCLDHHNWDPLLVYADNNNIPTICPSKSVFFFPLSYIFNTKNVETSNLHKIITIRFFK